MKKVITLIAIAILGLSQTAEAKIVNSRTVGERTKAPTIWILRTGLSLNGGTGSAISNIKDECKGYNNEYGDEGKVSFGFKPGYELSVAFNRPFGNTNFYWGMELGLGTRGIKYTSEYSPEDDWIEYGHKSLLAWNFKYSPFTFGYKYNINESIALDAHLGAYVSLDFAGKGKSSWDGIEQGDAYKEDEESANIGKDDLEHYKRFDCGLQVGLGVWYKRFNFDITYQRGFMNAYDFYYQSQWDIDEDSKICTSNIMFRIGMSF